ncbi:MAG: hypothetical protein GF393_03485 [Armatimonadia bacterium]|nr:hypothetical protein [Armatimonadia bacterium]
MKLDRVIDELHIEKHADGLKACWDASQDAAPEGIPEFLTPDGVKTGVEAAYIPQKWLDALLAAADAIASSKAATAVAWHARYCLHEVNCESVQVRSWPRLVDGPLGEPGALLYLLALISGYEGMQQVHREHEVPEDVVADTLSQIELYLRQTTEEQGFPEVPPRLIGWLMNHYTGIIYKLARLQFQFGNSRYRIRVFRNTKTDQVVALSEDGVRYREDGQLSRARDNGDPSWEASLTVTDESAEGYPIVPEGHALPEPIHLPLDEWGQVLAPDDPVLHIHIPGGEPMAFDQCGEAFEGALEFFPRHFPGYQFKAFTCGSWILDTSIQELAKPTSNMVRFQREVYLFPIGLREDSLPSGLFGGLLRDMPEDLSNAPCVSSLQRAYLDAKEAGTLPEPGGGGCFLLPEDVAWGAQVYLKQERVGSQ